MAALFWTFPVILLASVVIGWGAEILALRLTAGVALAVLAWLQTSPEFAVEATIAWHRDTNLALANLTGSLRLLLGLGWPMIFFIHWGTARIRKYERVRDVKLSKEFQTEALGLTFPVLYFIVIYLKRTWTMVDGAILIAFYGVYFWLLLRRKKTGGESGGDAHDDDPWLVRKVSRFSPAGQWAVILALFAVGGLALYFTVHSFIESLKATALALGVSEFIFIQWIAPIASEFPEKVTAFGWARKPRKVPFAIVNMLSSVTSQWTLLAGMVPILFSLSAGHPFTITFTDFQRQELLLTIAQSALTVALLADLKITGLEMVGYFVLWVVQLVSPSIRPFLTPVYLAWTGAEASRLLIQAFFSRKK